MMHPLPQTINKAMAKKCAHEWEWLMPEPKEIEEKHRISYALEINVLGSNLSSILYCPKCKTTGHYIKSHKSGVRKHTTDHFINKANLIKQKYNLSTLTNNKD